MDLSRPGMILSVTEPRAIERLISELSCGVRNILAVRGGAQPTLFPGYDTIVQLMGLDVEYALVRSEDV